MEFISLLDKQKNLYTITNNISNKYIITFLSENKLLVSVTNDLITFGADTLKDLSNNLDINYIDTKKIIYDVGCQILLLKEEKMGIKYFDIKDIVVINSNIYLFINQNKLYNLLDKKHINLDKQIKSYEYGVIDYSLIKSNSLFIPPEFKKKSYIYYTSSFYSFAKLILHIFDLTLEDITYTSLYYFLTRCLEPIPENRIFLYL